MKKKIILMSYYHDNVKLCFHQLRLTKEQQDQILVVHSIQDMRGYDSMPYFVLTTPPDMYDIIEQLKIRSCKELTQTEFEALVRVL